MSGLDTGKRLNAEAVLRGLGGGGLGGGGLGGSRTEAGLDRAKQAFEQAGRDAQCGC